MYATAGPTDAPRRRLAVEALVLCNQSRMFDALLQANDRYASDFSLAGIPAVAAKGFALVTCMDSRIEPLVMLGLVAGDAKILRNAGGRVTNDVLRSLVLATSFLNVTEIAVMQHTGCALAGRSDDAIRADLSNQVAARASTWDFGGMPEPDVALTADIAAVRTCALLPPGIRVEGWRYDVDTGAIRRIIAS